MVFNGGMHLYEEKLLSLPLKIIWSRRILWKDEAEA